jgi:ATP-dependent helicase HrpB
VVGAVAPLSGGVAVLRAEPGSGKSTLVPLALAAAASAGPAGIAGKVLMLEPRRVAAVGVASRMADLAGEEVGGLVGYSVRLERRVSARTAVEVVTEGLLARRLVEDSSLEGVGTVIFDEFHERSVHADLALALLLDLRVLRPDLSILVMSATIDAGRLADFLSDATGAEVASIDCPGRPFPVSVEYAPPRERKWIGTAAGEAVLRELAGTGEGDILVFLPGRREIDDAADAVRRGLGPGGGAEVLVLHGGVPLDKQRAIVRPAGRGSGGQRNGAPRNGAQRRVILATNIAQTSLTVPGVSTVIDTGLVRLQRRHAASGMDRLILEAASEADCDQRAGRAGRLGPGRCVRLWSPGDPRPRETEAEILRTELSSLVLDCALWGASSPLSFSWLDPPPEAGAEDAAELLQELGALDESGRPTDRGRRMARLGVHPRLAALALDGAAAGLGAVACVAAAALSDRDGSGLRDDADFLRRLSVLRGGRDADASGPGVGAWAERVRESARDLRSRLGGGSLSYGPADEAALPPLLAAAFPDRIARRQESGLFRVPAGREFRVDGPLSREEWLVVPEADAGERSGTARLAAALRSEDAERALSASYSEARTERIRVEWEGLAPRSFSCRRAGRLTLAERRVKTDPGALPEAFAELLAERGLSLLPWDSKGASPAALLDRIRFWGRRGGPAGAFADAALVAEAASWLGPFLRADGGDVVDSAALREALRARLGYRDAAELDRVVPESLETPAGTRRRLEYAGDDVFLDVRIQEVFGLGETPRILGVPVTLRLLSPAERPLQTTRDLASFWRTTYAEVRKELRGRYPRHYWPEDPLVAEPTSRPKPRGT